MVGAVLVKGGKIIGRGWHRRAGRPHAEIEAIANARRGGYRTQGATLYVTLEPCSTHGRTPPCTDAIRAAGIARVVIGAIDPNPKHAGRALKSLRRSGVEVARGPLAAEAEKLNESFNHWIVHKTPWVVVKAAMTLDGKIATATGESKWITSKKSRAASLHLRQGADAILVGVNTVLADNPKLTARGERSRPEWGEKILRRIILDPRARTPLEANVVCDSLAAMTTVVVSRLAPAKKIAALSRHVRVLLAPSRRGRIDLRWLLKKMGRDEIASLLVEGGGETNALFFENRLVDRIFFFYAPKIVGGRQARKAVAGVGVRGVAGKISLTDVSWRRVGEDLLLAARVA